MSKRIDNLAVAGSVVLIVALSFEIVSTGGGAGVAQSFTPYYIAIEGVVCALFIVRFFVTIAPSHNPYRLFWRRLPLLLISIPYLAIMMLCSLRVDREVALGVGLLPILRAVISFYRLFMRLVTSQSIDKIIVAYLTVILLFSYLAALIFYDVESGVNERLHGLGNAVWWALMSLTTVGAEIYPVTTLGKILSVVLPLLGMMLLPLFTSYIIALHRRPK